MDRYRRSVVAVIQREDGKILVGKGTRSLAEWQLPQGGVESGESVEIAVRREIEEETSLKTFEIVSRTHGVITYDWPPEHLKRGGPYIGQSQTYFLISVRSVGVSEIRPSVDFSEYEWLLPAEILSRAIPMRKAAYRAAFVELGLLG